MHRRTAQSMMGMLMVSAMSVAAFAQETPPALPPAGAPVIASQAAVAATAPSTVAATPATQDPTPSLPTVPAAPAETATAKPSIGSVLSDMARNATPTVTGTEVKTYSYGTSDLSILFLPMQTDRMQQAIRTYENSAGTSKTTFVAAEPVVEAAKTQVISEPASYPVFYLASIAYHSPSDWSVWVSGHKITSRKNDTDLAVVHVTPDSVTFSWAPTYISAISQRHAQKQFASTAPVKNRMLKSQPINLNEIGNNVTFTLHPNQSFSAGYFSMFEGFIAAPAMPAVTIAANPEAGEPLTGSSTPMPTSLNATLPRSPMPPANVSPTMLQRPGMPPIQPGAAMPLGMTPPNR